MLDGSCYSEIIDYVSYTQIWTNFSIRMVIKTSNAFFVLDEEGYPEVF